MQIVSDGLGILQEPQRAETIRAGAETSLPMLRWIRILELNTLCT